MAAQKDLMLILRKILHFKVNSDIYLQIYSNVFKCNYMQRACKPQSVDISRLTVDCRLFYHVFTFSVVGNVNVNAKHVGSIKYQAQLKHVNHSCWADTAKPDSKGLFLC